ncbi:EamA family transporter [Hymenobacter sp. GOD-10R]|jgi:transporter family protein|uniref:EamA family transporter n=1 Tax=Hymenobacter sp. GOD-10R TaxID=3093922 RepID=UPI002D77BC63|nr:EamA family transporter [Hymenobacter sp. GOD-10R]WRQ31385.1 EamA family transporter [Hymenobacter sp. GOD-10R]
MWWTYALLSAVFTALTVVLAKVGMRGIDSSLATAIRLVVALVMAWGVVYWRGSLGQLGGLTRSNWLFLGASGLTLGISWLCYFKGLQLGQVSQVVPVTKLSVALALVMSAFLLGENLSRLSSLGALLIVAGTVLMII